MTTKSVEPESPSALPIGPTAEEWCAMTPDERARFLVHVNEAVSLRRSARLKGMVEELEAMAEHAIAKAELAAAQVEQARVGTRATILALLEARGIACPDDTRARLLSCDDLPTLQRWLVRATTADSAVAVFEG